MKISRRIAALAGREVKRLVAHAGMRAALPESIRNSRVSFRPLSPHGRLILMVLGGLAEFRGPQARESPWRPVWSPAQADAAPAPRSYRGPRYR